MWISARSATTLAAAALLLVMVAVAAPLIPRPRLPSLPEERTARTADKFGVATAALESPERVRAQRMAAGSKATPSGARWGARAGSGTAETPDAATVARLRALLQDVRTVADPHAVAAEPTWVVRLVRDDHRIDVMVDADHDRLMVVRDGKSIGGFAIAGLHREYAVLGDALFKP